MRSTVLIFGPVGGKRKETELNERIAEKEKEGWEVVDMQINPTCIRITSCDYSAPRKRIGLGYAMTRGLSEG